MAFDIGFQTKLIVSPYCMLFNPARHSVSTQGVKHVWWKFLRHIMRLLLQNIGYFEMQMIGIFQMLTPMMLLGPSYLCLVCPLFHNFLQVSIVKSQKYDSVSFLAECPRILGFKILNPTWDHLRKWPKPGALCQKKIQNLICAFSLC